MHKYLHKTFDLVGDSLNAAGILVTFAVLAFPKQIEANACNELEGDYMHDTGKLIFWVTFASSVSIFPLSDRYLRKKYPGYIRESELQRHKKEVFDAIETILFLVVSARLYNVSDKAAWILYVLGGWPIIATTIKAFNNNFARGPYEVYDAQSHSDLALFDDNRIYKKYIMTLFEMVYMGLSLGSAISVVADLLFNVFYDTWHDNVFSAEDKLSGGLILLGFVLGLASVVSRKSWTAVRMSEAGINMFYFTFMISATSLACASKSTMTESGFKHKGWVYCLVFAILSTLFSAVLGDMAKENPYELDSEEVVYPNCSRVAPLRLKGIRSFLFGSDKTIQVPLLSTQEQERMTSIL